ncbi:MAG: acyl-CoA dehydrogenase family protein [Pseudomonadota bacterium]
MTDADTLRLLQDAATSFASFDAKRVRSWRYNDPGFDRNLWQEMAAQGWFGILADEASGGMELGLDAVAVVARALGQAAVPEPFVAAGVVAPKLLADCKAGATRDAALQDIVAGQSVATLAWQSPSGSFALDDIAVTAAEKEGAITLSGEARFVPIAAADSIIVAAKQAGGIGLWWLSSSTEGLTIEPEDQADGSRTGWLRLANVAVGPDSSLAPPNDGRDLIEAALDAGVVANCAELMGMMDRSLELTLDYLKVRKQFGQAIGSFQVLQHRAVDLWMQKEVARHATEAAIKALDSESVTPTARAISASSAKARVGEVALKMANETVQLHGAIGFTDEYDLGLYVNRILAAAPYLGNAADHRKRYGELKQDLGAAA